MSFVSILILLFFCQNLSAGNIITFSEQFNLAIPDAGSETRGWMRDATINIDQHIIISDLDVVLNVTHTQVHDLKILLQSPNGTEICLNSYAIKDFFEGENYNNTVFDDEALLAIGDAEAPFTGSFRPKEGNLLSTFDGTDAYGDWKLRIEDLYYSDSGYLEKFELRITTPEPATIGLLLLGSILSLQRRSKMP
jgi:subtilisin-like proprotein convertase family protein